VTTQPDERTTTGRPAGSSRRQRWWLELPLAVLFYYVYSRIRDLHGDATEHSQHVARSHGLDILHVEKVLHIDVEHGVQHIVLPARDLVIAMDVFYGTAHFILTCLVFLWLLFRGTPQRFRHGRNVLAIGTAIGLVVFAFYPTMPPRLMPPGIKTIDTASTIGGLWSYNHGVLEHITDPYAAMPSLHIVWSSWVAYVLWRGRSATSRWRKLFWLYPIVTGFTIIATGVHWTLDLAGGAVVFAMAVAATHALERFHERRAAGSGPPGHGAWGSKSSSDIDSEIPLSRETAT
jgi:hypothetical protein